MEIFTEINYYSHAESEAKMAINFLIETGWKLIETLEIPDLISRGFGSSSWQEQCIVITKKFKIYKGI